jgi:hypothetical protein
MELTNILRSDNVNFIKLNGTLNFTDVPSNIYRQFLIIGNNKFIIPENKLSNKKVKITNNSNILISISTPLAKQVSFLVVDGNKH